MTKPAAAMIEWLTIVGAVTLALYLVWHWWGTP